MPPPYYLYLYTLLFDELAKNTDELAVGAHLAFVYKSCVLV